MIIRTTLPTAMLLLLLGCSQHPDNTIIDPQLTTICQLASYEETTTIQGQSVSGSSRTSYQASFDADGQLTTATSSDKTQAAANAFETQATSRVQYYIAGFVQHSVTTTQTIYT